MILEIITDEGVWRSPPLRIEANQVVIRQANGTPVCVAAKYGPEGAIAVTHAGDDDFQRMLKNLGIMETVIVDTIELPQPPRGARLISGPHA